MSSFVPLYDRVLLKREEEPPASTLIHVPDSAKEKPLRGRIIAVGGGRIVDGHTQLVPLQVYTGQLVLFDKYSGTDIKVNGEEFVCIKEQGILGVLNGG